MRPNQRWNRMIDLVEASGYTVSTNDSWYGVGSSYLTVGTTDKDGYDVTITVRMSDHAQKAGGGIRYNTLTDDFDRSGESEVSIHPGSGVTLRNVVSVVREKMAEAVRQMELIVPGGHMEGK